MSLLFTHVIKSLCHYIYYLLQRVMSLLVQLVLVMINVSMLNLGLKSEPFVTLSSFKPCQLVRHKKVSERASRYIMLERREGKKPLSQLTTLKHVFPARAARISDESCGCLPTFVGLHCLSLRM